MRRWMRRKIIETVSEMIKRHAVIGQAFLQGDGNHVGPLLAQCQEEALWIGNAIEAERVFDQGIIHKLEEYCEDLYLISEGRAEASVWQKLNQYVTDVREYITHRTTERLEVAFFPYKASMWDSLESVWMAADRDAACDAYVVPVPYFDKNPDGSVSAMHDETDLFPDYVPVVRWDEYDVASRRPDIMYIHNPYDQANKVTTIHPDFYAKELKKHTDLLVYIPYFVCMDSLVPAHFCVLPGTMHADRVIVQSEKAREIYIREFQKFEEEFSCRGKFGDPQEKFVALGSPKYDKVTSAEKEDMEIPEDWLAKIMRPDGSRRNVLLYNTSVTQLLEGEERVLKKIRSVLALLKGREDLALLWRPHPLSQTTYAAMRPKWMDEYLKIVEEYRSENWGIYDDTPDLHRAIAVSDAYYGDISSLVDLYRLTGKPIMIQSTEVV